MLFLTGGKKAQTTVKKKKKLRKSQIFAPLDREPECPPTRGTCNTHYSAQQHLKGYSLLASIIIVSIVVVVIIIVVVIIVVVVIIIVVVIVFSRFFSKGRPAGLNSQFSQS